MGKSHWMSQKNTIIEFINLLLIYAGMVALVNLLLIMINVY